MFVRKERLENLEMRVENLLRAVELLNEKVGKLASSPKVDISETEEPVSEAPIKRRNDIDFEPNHTFHPNEDYGQ